MSVLIRNHEDADAASARIAGIPADAARFLLASIVASSDHAIISKTRDGTITSWNNGAEAIFGYSEEEAIGRHISLLAVPGDEQDMPQIIERVMRGEQIGRAHV